MKFHRTPRKRYSLVVLAVLLLALAGVGFVFASNNFAIRSMSLVAIVISAWLVRVSNVHDRSDREPQKAERAPIGTGKRLVFFAWVAGIGSLLAAGISYVYLREDALNGYHQVLPVYAFAIVALVCAVTWGYIAAHCCPN